MDPNSNEIPGLGLPQPSAVQGVPPNHTAASGQSPAAPAAQVPADDASDGLDEEWVNKAKAIVEKTKNDPFLESRELNKVRADYLKTRYNKHIKVSEDQSQ